MPKALSNSLELPYISQEIEVPYGKADKAVEYLSFRAFQLVLNIIVVGRLGEGTRATPGIRGRLLQSKGSYYGWKGFGPHQRVHGG